MTASDRRRLVAAVGVAVVAVVLALSLAGVARGIALYGYILALAGLTAAGLGSRIRRAWLPTPPFERLFPVRVGPAPELTQLEELVHRLAGGQPSDGDLHHRLRPLVGEIAAARLAARHGLDLEPNPERAQQLVGPRTWELIRPDREPPHDRFARSWTGAAVGELVDELERL